MEYISGSIGEIRNNWKKYIDMILAKPELCVMVTRRLNQHAVAKDKRFLCVISGEKYLELNRLAYGEESEKELKARLCQISGQVSLFDEEEK